MSELVAGGWGTGGLFFAFLRFTAFLVSSPFPGNMTPAPVRVLLAGGLALASQSAAPVPPDVIWVRAVLVEVALGLTMGFVMMLCLQAFALAGEVGGAQMGLANAGLGNPLAIDVNLMGSGYTFLVLAFFVVGEGPARMLILLQRSFEMIPAGAGGWPIAQSATAIVGDPQVVGGLAKALFWCCASCRGTADRCGVLCPDRSRSSRQSHSQSELVGGGAVADSDCRIVRSGCCVGDVRAFHEQTPDSLSGSAPSFPGDLGLG